MGGESVARESLLTIGLPVYNASSTVREAISSLLNQSFHDFVLIISDNASDDGTFEICQEFARFDSRIKLIRQDTNIGPYRNFRAVYEASNSAFFCWAAADDTRSVAYFAECLRHLTDNSSASIVGCANTHTDGRSRLLQFSITGKPEKRVRQFLRHAFKSNGIFYSVFKRDDLKDFEFDQAGFFAFDWAIILHLLLKGDFHRVPGGILHLAQLGESTRPTRWKSRRTRLLHWFVPLLEFNRYCISKTSRFSLVMRFRIMFGLLRINLFALLDQVWVETKRVTSSRRKNH